MSTSPSRAALGFWTCLALVVGNMIGSGVYMLPATLAPLGWNGMIGWFVTIGGALCLAFVFARLGAKLPCAGGPYAFTRAAFGPGAGFAVAWSYWVLIWCGNAAVAVAVVSALSLIFPALGSTPGLPAIAALVAIWGLIAVNIRGVALAGKVQFVTTVLKLLPLIGVILLAVWLLLRDGSGAIAPYTPVPLGVGSIAGAAAITFWGFLGVESATVPADKVANAASIVPRVTLIGTVLTGVVYVLVSAATMFLMPAAITAASPSPIAEFLGRGFGSGTADVVALFAAISAFGALNGFILLQGEVPWAMARGGVFPAWLAKESSRGTPARAHLVSGVLVTIVTLMNYTSSMGQLFQDIASISLASGMLAYLACALAAIRLLPDDLPLKVAAAVAAAFVVWMVYGLGVKADLWGLVLLLLGLPVYWSVRRERLISSAATAP